MAELSPELGHIDDRSLFLVESGGGSCCLSGHVSCQGSHSHSNLNILFSTFGPFLNIWVLDRISQSYMFAPRSIQDNRTMILYYTLIRSEIRCLFILIVTHFLGHDNNQNLE